MTDFGDFLNIFLGAIIGFVITLILELIAMWYFIFKD